LRESKKDKTFTQHKHDKYSLQTKTQKPTDKYFRKARESPGEFVTLVIVLRFLRLAALWAAGAPLLFARKLNTIIILGQKEYLV